MMVKTGSAADMTKTKLLLSCFLALMCILVTVAVYAPNLIYFSQREFFSDYFFQLILQPLFYSFMVVIVALLVLAILPKAILRYLTAVLLILTLLLWLQVDYFAVSYGVLDGTELNFKSFDLRGWFEVSVLLLAVVLAIILQKFFNKNLPFIVLLLMIGQLALVAVNVSQEPQDKDKVQSVDAEFHQYSNDKNVLLIILDTFGAEYFQNILLHNPEMVDGYPGFVSYTDAISNYPATMGSLPSLLRGEMLPENVKLKAFINNDIQNNGLPKQFENKGYLVSLISSTNWMKGVYPQRYVSEITIEPKIMEKYHSFQLFDYALFRTSIHWLKPKIFNQGQWLFSAQISSKAQIPNTPAEKGRMLIDDLTKNAVIKDEKPRFKVIHLTVPHPEYVYDKSCDKNSGIDQWPVERKMLEQSQCAIKKLNEFLAQMKAQDSYDNSLIVVTSDHGARVFNDQKITGFPSQFELKSSGIFFMIKGINQRRPFRQVSQPFSLLALFPALMDENLHQTDYSNLLDNDRKFYAYQNWYTRARGFLPDAPIYRVDAQYTNRESWHLLDYAVHDCVGQNMPLTMTFETLKREGYCATFGFQKPAANGGGTWTEGIDSRIIFNLNNDSIQAAKDRTVRVDFETDSNLPQSETELSVYLNSELLGVQTINKFSEQMVEFKFSNDILLQKENILKLQLSGEGFTEEFKFMSNFEIPGIKIQSIKLQ